MADDVQIKFGGDVSGLQDAARRAQDSFATMTANVDKAAQGFSALSQTIQQSAGSSGAMGVLADKVDLVDQKFTGLAAKIQAAQQRLQAFSTNAVSSFAKGQAESLQGLMNQVVAAGSVRNFAALSGGAVGVGLLGAGFAAAAAESLDKLQKIADQANITASQLSGLQTVFGKLGLSTDQTNKVLVNLESNLLDAKAHGGALKDALDAAGISFQQANGQLRPTIEVLQDIVNKMRATQDASANTALATKALGDEMAGPFANAVKQGGTALTNLQAATHTATSAISDDMARMAQQAIGALDSMWDRMNSVYSRMKELAGFNLSGTDQANVAREHMQEAQGALVNLQAASLVRDVSSDEIKKAWQRIFDAGKEIAASSPIAVLPGGDPRVKPKAPPSIAPADDAGDDADSGSGSDKAAKAAAKQADRAAEVIQKLREQLSLLQSVGAEHQRISDEIKTQAELKAAGVKADSDQGRIIADLVAKTDATTEALKRQKEIATTITGEFERIGSSVSSSLVAIVERTGNLRDLMRGVARSMASDFLGAVTKMGADYAASIATMVLKHATGEQAMSAATAVGVAERSAAQATALAADAGAFFEKIGAEIAADAAGVFGGVFSFLAPFLGPAAAGPAAGAEATVIAAGAAIPSHGIGSWALPSDMLSLVHKGEMIVPAAQTPWAQSLMSSAAGNDGSSSAPLHLHLNHTSYGSRSRQAIDAEMGDVVKALFAHMKTNAPTWRKHLERFR